MKYIFALLFVVSVVALEVYAGCDFDECDSGCRSRGNALGRCKSDTLCECVNFGSPKCNFEECDSGCRSRGNTLGRCKGDHVCECVVVRG